MANVDHSTLTDPYLHEPKGIASALVNQVYVANGAGSGSWTNISRAVKSTGNADQTLTAATLTILDFDTVSFNTGGYTVSGTGRVTIPATGLYLITAGVTVEATVAALTSGSLVITNNAEVLTGTSFDQTLSTSSVATLSCCVITALTASDIVDARLIASGAGVPVVRRTPTFVGLSATQVNHLAIQRIA